MSWHVNLDFSPTRSPVPYLKRQSYFLMGLRSRNDVRLTMSPRSSAIFAKLLERNVKGSATVWSRTSAILHSDATGMAGVARYIFRHHSLPDPVGVAIDTSDGRGIQDNEAYDWSDIYFKTNRWESFHYPDKVRPLINANGSLDSKKLDYLRSLRGVEATRDLIYWTKIWEPQKPGHNDEVELRNIVEHQLRLFETLSTLNCTKSLLAVFMTPLRSMDTNEAIKRLEGVGVKCQWGWRDITSAKFWQNLASARIVFLRPGNHFCISWRMTDLLCLGSCIVYDGMPYPQWYQPLVSGHQYVAGQCRLGADYSLPPKTSYVALNSVISQLLSDPARVNALKQKAVEYFDQFCTPKSVARYILDQVGETCLATEAMERNLPDLQRVHSFSALRHTEPVIEIRRKTRTD